jgi:hypothetical protein
MAIMEGSSDQGDGGGTMVVSSFDWRQGAMRGWLLLGTPAPQRSCIVACGMLLVARQLRADSTDATHRGHRVKPDASPGQARIQNWLA